MLSLHLLFGLGDKALLLFVPQACVCVCVCVCVWIKITILGLIVKNWELLEEKMA